MELDDDDEIPAPFEQCDQLMTNKQDKQMFQIVNEKAPIVEDAQGNSLFDVNHKDLQDQKLQSEVNDADDDEEEEPIDIQSMSNVENLIDEITKEKVPKKKSKMKQRKTPSHQVLDNHPPKRFGPASGQGLYPMIGIENEEQRRLAVIADNISGVTQRLAMDNGRYNLGMDSQID